MSSSSSAIPMSQIIASDAPLLSPVSGESWDQVPLYSPTAVDNFALNYHNMPPSPPASIGSTSTDSSIPTSRMLKMRMSPDSASENEQLCLPTHQLFDFPEAVTPPSGPSPSPAPPNLQPQRPSININPHSHTPPKRVGAAMDPGVTKKPRAIGERINSKDFVPPDVSGLSKREARLVKNRAAAFLSRQRKREEFETMEVRVAELEQENARLLALTQNGNASSNQPEAIAENERLRAQLVAAEERERELSAELTRKLAVRDAPVKAEPIEPQFPHSSQTRSTSLQSPHKSAASFGLMVLLCALPSLLSMPTQSALPTSFSLPGSSALHAQPSSTLDFNHLILNEYDWPRNSGSGSIMDLDIHESGRIATAVPTATTKRRQLEFVDGALAGLGALDISFEASPSEDGKIRVRIHPPSSSSRSDTEITPFSSSLSMWTSSEQGSSFGNSFQQGSSNAFSSSTDSSPALLSTTYAPTIESDPFLGVGSDAFEVGMSHFSSDGSLPMSWYEDQEGLSTSVNFGQLQPSEPTFGFGSAEFGRDVNRKRRVRIALKNMPAPGGEGGEWEVQFC